MSQIDDAIADEEARRKKFKGFAAQAPGDLDVQPSPSPSPTTGPLMPFKPAAAPSSFLEEIKQKLHDYLFPGASPATGPSQADALRGK